MENYFSLGRKLFQISLPHLNASTFPIFQAFWGRTSKRQKKTDLESKKEVEPQVWALPMLRDFVLLKHSLQKVLEQTSSPSATEICHMHLLMGHYLAVQGPFPCTLLCPGLLPHWVSVLEELVSWAKSHCGSNLEKRKPKVRSAWVGGSGALQCLKPGLGGWMEGDSQPDGSTAHIPKSDNCH